MKPDLETNSKPFIDRALYGDLIANEPFAEKIEKLFPVNRLYMLLTGEEHILIEEEIKLHPRTLSYFTEYFKEQVISTLSRDNLSEDLVTKKANSFASFTNKLLLREVFGVPGTIELSEASNFLTPDKIELLEEIQSKLVSFYTETISRDDLQTKFSERRLEVKELLNEDRQRKEQERRERLSESAKELALLEKQRLALNIQKAKRRAEILAEIAAANALDSREEISAYKHSPSEAHNNEMNGTKPRFDTNEILYKTYAEKMYEKYPFLRRIREVELPKGATAKTPKLNLREVLTTGSVWLRGSSDREL